jgi:hypothetical protein
MPRLRLRLRLIPSLALALALPADGRAQEGAITFDRSTRYAFELPEQIRERVGDEIPGEEFAAFLLLFSPTETVMLPAPDADAEEEGRAADSPPDAAPGRGARIRNLMARMRTTSIARSDHERLVVAHVDLVHGVVTESRAFMGRLFLIQDSPPAPEWRLTGEQSDFAGFLVLKALAEIEGVAVEAWFAPQIPVPGGPGGYGGLPGMILSLSLDSGRVVYSATDVRMAPVDPDAIRPPVDGESVSAEEYEQVVGEKLEELQLLQTQRRRRGPGGRP